MIAKDGEYVPFTVATDCSGEVEVTAMTQSSHSRKLTQFYNIISEINYNTKLERSCVCLLKVYIVFVDVITYSLFTVTCFYHLLFVEC